MAAREAGDAVTDWPAPGDGAPELEARLARVFAEGDMQHCKIVGSPSFNDLTVMHSSIRRALASTTATVAVFLSTTLSPAVAADAPKAPVADLTKGQATAQVCSACHTADGSRGSPANPILAGQHPEYLVKQLTEFKSGARANAVMKGFASTLSEADMLNVAAFYAGKQAKPGASKDKTGVALGRSIYRAGIADRAVPACAGCHGAAGAGIPSQYPRLAGQHADYTDAQLTAFRSKARGNNASMTTIAAKLSDAEIKAVSDYLASLQAR
jgi:cytochrome c553